VLDRQAKDHLHRYLQRGRDAVLWKLDGVSPYDARRPLSPTGTNLLGLVKHLAGVEAEYLGLVFDRPFPERLAWTEEDTEPNADMWATADESQDDIVALYRRVWVHADATIDALDLEATGEVPWWAPEHNPVTLHDVLVHLTAETYRHAGHADLVRELIDGQVGMMAGNQNLPPVDEAWWAAYRERLERVAREVGGR
jgi:hypothetical protein